MRPTTKTDKRRYWDSSVFLGYFNDTDNRRRQCLPIITAAESGKTLIITSTLTLAEIFWMEKEASFDQDTIDKVKDFFGYSFIGLSDLTRTIAERAQEISQQYQSFNHWDSVHMATAIHSDIVLLETFNDDLLKYDWHFRNQNGEEISITKPFISHQTEIDF
ncbi:MAG: PIN domain-containing protein [Bacteroidetes bacterium]|nr:PIN domain-containing protein [Bacteroidota bacterium]MCY4223944.1 PIN domain-containing protein [Bacteroidota bacterium]